MKILFNFLLLLILFVVALPVFAEEHTAGQALRVSPAILPLMLSPGKTINLELTIENITDSPIPLGATIESFESAGEEGRYNFNSVQSPLATWITIDRPEIIIDPGVKRIISVTVKVPAKVEVGGYYAVIFLTPQGPLIPDKPKIIPRIGIPVFASLGIDENMSTGSLETFTVTPQISRSKTVSYTIRVKNSGLSHFTAKPVLQFKQLFGKTISQDLSDKVILPGKIRRWDGQIGLGSAIGIFEITASVSMGNGRWITQKTYAAAMPWPEMLAGSVIILLIFIIATKRNNLSKAIKVLLSK